MLDNLLTYMNFKVYKILRKLKQLFINLLTFMRCNDGE